MIDPGEAPEGFEAVGVAAELSCQGCAFEGSSYKPCHYLAVDERLCFAEDRKDGHEVIFKKKEKQG